MFVLQELLNSSAKPRDQAMARKTALSRQWRFLSRLLLRSHIGIWRRRIRYRTNFSVKFPSHAFAWRFCSARENKHHPLILLGWKCNLEQRWPPGEISEGPVICWVPSVTFLWGAVTSYFHPRNMKVTKAGKWEAGTKGELLSPKEEGNFKCLLIFLMHLSHLFRFSIWKPSHLSMPLGIN